jgi:hypothetical protein
MTGIFQSHKVTENETNEVDLLLSQIYTLGDRVRKLPDDETKMENNLCRF